MSSKIHINLNQGLIEAEGSEELVLAVYQDFKELLKNDPPQNGGDHKAANPAAKPQAAQGNKKPKAKAGSTSKKRSGGQSYSLVKDLNLYAEGNLPSLEDFMKGFTAETNMPRYLLIVHYLKEIKNVEKVGVNEIYTCFKKLNYKIPKIEQGLWDTSNRKGWLNTSSLTDVTIEVAGENAIAHDLVKPTEQPS